MRVGSADPHDGCESSEPPSTKGAYEEHVQCTLVLEHKAHVGWKARIELALDIMTRLCRRIASAVLIGVVVLKVEPAVTLVGEADSRKHHWTHQGDKSLVIGEVHDEIGCAFAKL